MDIDSFWDSGYSKLRRQFINPQDGLQPVACASGSIQFTEVTGMFHVSWPEADGNVQKLADYSLTTDDFEIGDHSEG